MNSKKELLEKKRGSLFSCSGSKKDTKRDHFKDSNQDSSSCLKNPEDFSLSLKYIIKHALQNTDQRISRCPIAPEAKYMPGYSTKDLLAHLDKKVRRICKRLPKVKAKSSSLVDLEKYPGYPQIKPVSYTHLTLPTNREV